MVPFAWQNLLSTAVAMVVWGRSEVLLLEYFNADKVVSSTGHFTMAEQLLLVAPSLDRPRGQLSLRSMEEINQGCLS